MQHSALRHYPPDPVRNVPCGASDGRGASSKDVIEALGRVGSPTPEAGLWKVTTNIYGQTQEERYTEPPKQAR